MPTNIDKANLTAREALQFHSQGKPGKLEVSPTKPMATQRDLSLAYSPGVAIPVQAIAESPQSAYDYTNKGNLVAVISNGTAILGLGNLGAIASKPVMEGKAVLFKRFADVDAIDLEVDTEDLDEFINCVRHLGPAFGGINLEDIKAPDCFIIESTLRDMMDIPVFHDDQHGTAIIATAGLINAIDLTNRDIAETKIVCNGAGAAAISSIKLAKSLGIKAENIIVCDTKGVIYEGRTEGMNQWKAPLAAQTSKRTLEDAMEDADVFYGLSVKGAVTPNMVSSMADNPIIFAMANPDPEITPEEVAAIRDDAIVATGRSDYPNQINNVLGFPFIFRGALDVQASTINEEMKLAAARALAELARADVPDQVASAYGGKHPRYGKDYLIPATFDPRLVSHIPPAVAQAAMKTGVARRQIVDLNDYRATLTGRLDPTANWLNKIFSELRNQEKRVVFAEGEQLRIVRAASTFLNAGLGKPILIGREQPMLEALDQTGVEHRDEIEMYNASKSKHIDEYSEYLYERLQRQGFLLRDCQRLVKTDRNVFAACMVAFGHADAMVTGVTRSWSAGYNNIRKVLDEKEGHKVIGISIALCRDRTVLIADTSITAMPTAEDLADIAVEAAAATRRLGYPPRVALLAYSTFGQPTDERSCEVRKAVEILDSRDVDFEYDGDMAVDVALNKDAMSVYPFCRLSDTANILIMPAFHAASISTKMLQQLGGQTVIGPILVGLSKPVQIVPMSATDTDIVNMAAIAAYDIGDH